MASAFSHFKTWRHRRRPFGSATIPRPLEGGTMPILEVTDTDIRQHCAHCERERGLKLDDLQVGVARGQQIDPRLIPLPPCPSCGTVEFLIRSADAEPEHPAPGTFGH